MSSSSTAGTESAESTEAPSEAAEPTESPKTGLARLLERWKQTRVARGLGRYGAANGALLTGGIAYSALFSIFAGLAVGFSIFMALVGDNAGLQDAVLQALDSALPGVVSSESNPDGLTADDLQFSGGASLLTGVIGFLLLINAATAVMAALRSGIRAVFGIVTPAENAVAAKLRDLVGFLALALAVVLTAVLGIVVGTAGNAVAGAVGLEDNPVVQVLLRILGFAVALAVDFAVVAFLIRGLAGARPPRRDLVLGALVVAVAAGGIRLLGTSIVGGAAAANPLLAPYAVIITLLLWVNLIVRILLMVCAWTANPPAIPEVDPDDITHADETPNFVTETEPETLDWDHDPQTGRIRPEPPEPVEPPEYWGGLIGWAKRKYRGFRDA
ncbi:YihY/virulence factor BrkB family protein [Pseudactinotalea suaedae]|uniref:YihY/virulence factor BrkB family protein n=1 Tax=Pseudactinotalea suaedae TaxID=1524924 RepID=UPI0012E1BA1A|nr:YihY/virulence factor BrkB family protein [Pseudactinotalea suaedae]